jgi:hypothetical protein
LATDKPEIVPTAVPTASPPETTWSKPVMSKMRDLYARFRLDGQNNERYKVSLEVGSFPVGTQVISEDSKKYISNSEIVDELEKNDFYYPSSKISWSDSTNQFAVLMPSKITIYNYVKESINDADVLKIISSQDLPYNNTGSAKILFSGDGRSLFYLNNQTIKIVYPTEKEIVTTKGYSADANAIPGLPGVVYWSHPKTVDNLPDYRNYEIVLDSGRNKRIYPIYFDFAVDYPGDIDLSPGLDKACVGWGSSGSRGSVVLNLNTGKEIRVGKGCLRWITNNQVVVSSYSYDFYGYTTYFLVDLSSGKKTYLHDVYRTE